MMKAPGIDSPGPGLPDPNFPNSSAPKSQFSTSGSSIRTQGLGSPNPGAEDFSSPDFLAARQPGSVLVLNAGSSSIKLAVFELPSFTRLLAGKLERIGFSDSTLTLTDANGETQTHQEQTTSDDKSVVNFLIHSLEQHSCFGNITAVGHRVVQGMYHTTPALVTQALLNELISSGATDPEHLPRTLELMETLLWRHPTLTQVACFDTSFHHSLPTVARLLPIPRRYAEKGVRRYGFHGLSYAYLMSELHQRSEPAASRGKVILAHLGNGASMAAVLDGKSIDTSMGFTPAGGLPMGTRAGDLDSGLLSYLATNGELSQEQFAQMNHHESGLLGISETSADMEDLLQQEASDNRAAEAVALFCYQAKKLVGAYAAALGGLDVLVFAGGIGEQAPPVRERICSGLEFLGISLDETKNARADGTQPAFDGLISHADSRVRVYVLHTNEELMIARSVAELQ